MRIRQAKKIVEAAAHGQLPQHGKVKKALRTVWHRSRHPEGDKAGQRMGGTIRNHQIDLIAKVLAGRVQVDIFGRERLKER